MVVRDNFTTLSFPHRRKLLFIGVIVITLLFFFQPVSADSRSIADIDFHQLVAEYDNYVVVSVNFRGLIRSGVVDNLSKLVGDPDKTELEKPFSRFGLNPESDLDSLYLLLFIRDNGKAYNFAFLARGDFRGKRASIIKGIEKGFDSKLEKQNMKNGQPMYVHKRNRSYAADEINVFYFSFPGEKIVAAAGSEDMLKYILNPSEGDDEYLSENLKLDYTLGQCDRDKMFWIFAHFSEAARNDMRKNVNSKEDQLISTLEYFFFSFDESGGRGGYDLSLFPAEEKDFAMLDGTLKGFADSLCMMIKDTSLKNLFSSENIHTDSRNNRIWWKVRYETDRLWNALFKLVEDRNSKQY